MRIRNPIRAVFALLILTCILALFLAPGVSAAMAVQLNGGKQVIRVLTVIWLAALVSAIYRGALRSTALLFNPFRQIYVHGFGPALLDKTCARLC